MAFKNIEDKREYSRKWQAKNREKMRLWNKEWREKNKEYNLSRVDKWRAENPLNVKLMRIRYRCENPKCKCFKHYGGRGIKCILTLDEIKNLWLRDKANKMKYPSIDRINTDGHYEYGNCRFIEMSENIGKSNIERVAKIRSN